MEMAFRDCVHEAKERGQTVFLSSHILSEVEALCDRVGILRDGQARRRGHARASCGTERADGRGDVRGPGAGPAAAARVSRVSAGGPERRCASRSPGSVGPLIAALAGHRSRSLTSREPSLEEIFLHHYDDGDDRGRTAALSGAQRGGWRGLRVARRTFRDARVRTIAFAYLFAAVAFIQPVGYRHTYPTLADRLVVRAQLRHEQGRRPVLRQAVRPAERRRLQRLARRRDAGDLRAVFGLLAAVRALRAEEDTGRAELVLAGIVGRRSGVPGGARRRSPLAIVLLWLAAFAGLGRGRPRRRRLGLLALAMVSVVPVFVGVGALASQLAPTRRIALELGGAVVGARVPVARDRRHVQRRRLAAVGSHRWAGPRSCGRSPARSRWCCCCRSPRAWCCWSLAARICARARHRQRRACRPATRAAAAARAALLADRARRCAASGPACSSGCRASACSPSVVGVISNEHLVGGHLQAARPDAREARLGLGR